MNLFFLINLYIIIFLNKNKNNRHKKAHRADTLCNKYLKKTHKAHSVVTIKMCSRGCRSYATQ